MKYSTLKEQRQAEVNAFPFGFAFNQKQFDEMMSNWGLSPEDTDKIYSIGAGGFVQKKDADAMHEMFKRHNKRHKELMASDDEYALSAFEYELTNHEYGITWNPTDAVEALGLSCKEVWSNDRLYKLFKEAEKIFK